MKVFLVLAIAVLGMRHVLLDDGKSGGDSASADLPAWFQPESMSFEQKEDLRVQLEGALEEVEQFIANPPMQT